MAGFPSVAAWSPDSEVAVIAAAMAYPDECGPAIRRLQPRHFFDGMHQAIWSVISQLLAEGRSRPWCVTPSIRAPRSMNGAAWTS